MVCYKDPTQVSFLFIKKNNLNSDRKMEWINVNSTVVSGQIDRS